MAISNLVTVLATGFLPKQFSVFKKSLFGKLKRNSGIIDNHTDVLVVFIPTTNANSLRGKISKTIMIMGEQQDDVVNLMYFIRMNLNIKHIIIHQSQKSESQSDTGNDIT